MTRIEFRKLRLYDEIAEGRIVQHFGDFIVVLKDGVHTIIEEPK